MEYLNWECGAREDVGHGPIPPTSLQTGRNKVHVQVQVRVQVQFQVSTFNKTLRVCTGSFDNSIESPLKCLLIWMRRTAHMSLMDR